ncbi:MAG TPA: hypothetical protein PKL35_04650 [Methanoregulaceae archaeon]|nr:hypothetical protein [Methanoregulaceae archaeon]
MTRKYYTFSDAGVFRKIRIIGIVFRNFTCSYYVLEEFTIFIRFLEIV